MSRIESLGRSENSDQAFSPQPKEILTALAFANTMAEMPLPGNQKMFNFFLKKNLKIFKIQLTSSTLKF